VTRHAGFLAGPDTSLRVTPRSVARAVVGVGSAGEEPVPGREAARLVVLHKSETLARQLERVAATYLPHVEVVRCADFDAVDLLLAGGRRSS
jgi:hypothetical protein